ncbi:hypothetical protein O181_019934 [Austropuccinia psidii MF-1]|uniref:Reverse transcriptase n=1 Tax=Austropuccinia psidii MF-1 TaxID=1389203 RepID=A0A9Q3GV80_9BASI|nr:hypothetical protein [Austropuccinia psidii MF-1]
MSRHINWKNTYIPQSSSTHYKRSFPGKWVTTNPARSKPWWDKDQLNSLVKLRNQVRREILKNQAEKTKKEYYHYQQLFTLNIWELKSSHWRNLLSKKGPDNAYQEYKLTRERQEDKVIPPRNWEGNLTSDISGKSSLLFHGTLIVETTTATTKPPARFPPNTKDKVENEMSNLPNRKTPGPEGVPNELIKLFQPLLTFLLTNLYSLCLKQGKYPSSWKEAQTAIIRKASKDN